MHFSFLIYSNNWSSTCFGVTINHKEAVTVYAAYGIYEDAEGRLFE